MVNFMLNTEATLRLEALGEDRIQVLQGVRDLQEALQGLELKALETVLRGRGLSTQEAVEGRFWAPLPERFGVEGRLRVWVE